MQTPASQVGAPRGRAGVIHSQQGKSLSVLKETEEGSHSGHLLVEAEEAVPVSESGHWGRSRIQGDPSWPPPQGAPQAVVRSGGCPLHPGPASTLLPAACTYPSVAGLQPISCTGHWPPDHLQNP